MDTVINVIIVVLVVVIAVLAVLYFFGRKAQRKQVEQQKTMDAMAQNVSMLIIDKKKMKLKDAGLPAQVLEQTPKLMRNTKLPIVKAKVGARVMTLICDANIFEQVPVKKEVKAVVSGLYITSVKGIRGPLEQTEKKKKGMFTKLREKAQKAVDEQNAVANTKKKK